MEFTYLTTGLVIPFPTMCKFIEEQEKLLKRSLGLVCRHAHTDHYRFKNMSGSGYLVWCKYCYKDRKERLCGVTLPDAIVAELKEGTPHGI